MAALLTVDAAFYWCVRGLDASWMMSLGEVKSKRIVLL